MQKSERQIRISAPETFKDQFEETLKELVFSHGMDEMEDLLVKSL